MRERILELVTRHCATLRQEGADIDAFLRAAGPAPDGDARAGIVATAHKLKGSSGSIGFMRVSALAGDIESLLRDAGDRPLGHPVSQRLAVLHTELQSNIDAISPEQSTLLARFS